MIELKPCPFCGGAADLDAPSAGELLLYCKGCYASICEDSTSNVVAAWNRRAAAPAGPGAAQPFDFKIDPAGNGLRILHWHGDNGCRPASPEECALWDALATPSTGAAIKPSWAVTEENAKRWIANGTEGAAVDERAAFEAQMVGKGWTIHREINGEYSSILVNSFWEDWQARAARSQAQGNGS